MRQFYNTSLPPTPRGFKNLKSLEHNLLFETLSRVGYIFPSENPIYINKRRRYDTNLKHESAQQRMVSWCICTQNFIALQSCAEEF